MLTFRHCFVLCVTVILIVLIVSIIRFNFCGPEHVYGRATTTSALSSIYLYDELWVDDVDHRSRGTRATDMRTDILTEKAAATSTL